MDKALAGARIIDAALPIVPFEGWTQRTLQKAAQAAGYKRTDAIRVFPGGALDAIDFYMRQTDRQMIHELGRYHFDTMKIRQRIATGVMAKLEIFAPHREAVRRAVALLSMPFHMGQGMKHLYRTVDEIWHAAGDSSTDFNFYTKRALLAAVYSSTLLIWLDDQNPGFANTRAFLDRRIEDVMRIEKAKSKLRHWLEQLPHRAA